MPANFWGSLELAVPGKEHIPVCRRGMGRRVWGPAWLPARHACYWFTSVYCRKNGAEWQPSN